MEKYLEYIYVVDDKLEPADLTEASIHSTSFSDGFAAFARVLKVINDSNDASPDNMWEVYMDDHIDDTNGGYVFRGFGAFQFPNDSAGTLRAGLMTITLRKIPFNNTPVDKGGDLL